MSVLFSVNYFTLLNVVRVKLTNWHVIGKYVWFLVRDVRCVYILFIYVMGGGSVRFIFIRFDHRVV